MKYSNVTILFLVLFLLSFLLFKCRTAHAFTVPPPVTTANVGEVAAVIRSGNSAFAFNQSALDLLLSQAGTTNQAKLNDIAATYLYDCMRYDLKVIPPNLINTSESRPLYYTPPGVSSSLPMAGLVSGAGAIAGLAYYQRTGVDPVYAAANAVASAADHIFTPAYQAFRDTFVSPESFPAAASQYVGVDASIGISLGDLYNHVKSLSGQFPNLASFFQSNTPEAANIVPDNTFDQAGNIVFPANLAGVNYYINLLAGMNWTLVYPNDTIAWAKIAFTPVSGIYSYNDGSQFWISGSPGAYRLIGCFKRTNGNVDIKTKWIGGDAATTPNPTTYPANPVPNWESIKNALPSQTPQVKEEIREAINTAPQKDIGVSSNPSPSTAPAQVQPAINHNQVNNFYHTNATSVANYNTTNITSTSTIQDIARGQAATTAAQQQAQQAQNDYPKTITFSGSASLPDANQYDPTLEKPEEQNFVNKVHSFLNSGLSVLSAIRSSGLSASGSPRMNTSIWGHPVVIDFSDQQTPIRAAGSVLVIISLILAYLIVVRS